MDARQPKLEELEDPPLTSLRIGNVTITARRELQGGRVWMGTEAGANPRRALLRDDGEPSLCPAIRRGGPLKPIGGLFRPWTPAHDCNVRLVSHADHAPFRENADEVRLLGACVAAVGGGAWVAACSVQHPDRTWIEYVDHSGAVYLRRRLNSILAFSGITWTRDDNAPL
jgi:hypothetical protein